MGIYDRPYYSDDSENFSWRPAKTWSAVNALVAVNVLVFVLSLIYDPADGRNLQYYLALWDQDLFHPTRWFSIITYGFTHASLRSPNGIWHIVMNMFVLWMFGRHVEAHLGRNRFLIVYMTSIILCGLLTAIWHLAFNLQSNISMVGASGAVSTVLVYFCFLAPHARVIFFVFPMPAWVMGLIIVGMDFFNSFGAEDNVAHEAHLIGAALGAAFYLYGVPRSNGLGWLQQWWRKRRLRVVRVDEKKKEVLAAEADRILEKVNQSGYDSLTATEKKTLEKYSRDLRSRS